nr:hypothetical protein [Tanacetum cinerariifolium]
FDPIPQTSESSEDEGNGEEDQGLNIGEEERLNEEEEADELYRDQESSSVLSQFVTNMLNLTSDAGMQSIFTTASTFVAPLPITALTMTPSTTNQFAGAVSAIPGIVQHFMDERMNEAVQVAVQLQSDRLCEEAQNKNDEFLRTVDENIKKIIK